MTTGFECGDLKVEDWEPIALYSCSKRVEILLMIELQLVKEAKFEHNKEQLK